MKLVTKIFIKSVFTFYLFLFTLSATSQTFLSPTDLDLFNNGKEILITDRTGKQLLIYSISEEKIKKTIKLEQEPSGAICSTDGKTIYVTTGIGPGNILIIDSVSGKIQKSVPTGHGINTPILSKDAGKLYVCSRFDNSVKVIDLNNEMQTKSISVKREPVAAEITPDGKFLFVANHMPDGRADVDYVASKMSVIDLEKNEVIKTINLVNGAEGMRGVCVSPDGKYVYATHLMARFQVPTTQIERGWINTNALSVIRVSDQKLLYTVLLDDVDQGFSNPWAITVSQDARLLCVSAAGNHELRLINLPDMIEKINQSVKDMGENAEAMHRNTHNDLSFISRVSKRIKLKGLGPRALLMDNKTIYVAEYFSESLGKLTYNKNGDVTELQTIQLGASTPMTEERKGEILFNDASLCFQQWQSCASCHSDDGRVDALNWDLLNDGIGNPKNVKSLLLSHVTPPVMGLGVRADAETAVRAGIKYIQFAVRPEEDAQAIDAYLKSLKPVSSPKLENGELSQVAKQGKKIYEKAGCAHCHPVPLYTNLKSYDLGTGKDQDKGKKFDTSTLVEVWRTSPYWHDGRATTIEEAINLHYINSEYTLELTDNEMKVLVEYVESL